MFLLAELVVTKWQISASANSPINFSSLFLFGSWGTVTQEIGTHMCKVTEWQARKSCILTSKLIQLMIFPGSHFGLWVLETTLGEIPKEENSNLVN